MEANRWRPFEETTVMSTTHAAMGVLLVAPLALVAPELAAVAALAAYAGGVFPDLDVVYYHRRALHYPVLYWPPALAAAVAAALWPGPATVAAAAFFAAAALHSAVDVLGGGLGLRPWENDDDRGVYLHPQGRWLRARRLVRYDGAPEDFVLATALTIPGLVAFDGPVRVLLVGGVVASLGYALVRKRVVEVWVDIVE
jgi:hypothetical protein